MRQNLVSLACLPLVFAVILGSQSAALGQAQAPAEFVPGEVLVKFKPEVTANVIATLTAHHGLEAIKVLQRTQVHHLRILSKRSVQEVIARLRQSTAVEYAEPNYLRRLDLAPNDSGYPEMWGLNNTGQTGGTPDADIDAPQAWEIQTGSSSVVVAVIDSGMDLTHVDLAANLWSNPGELPNNGIDEDGNGFVDDVHGWDFRNDDNDPTDTSPLCSGHGTHTAGTIGAVGNNGRGVTGVNWQVKLMPLRVFGGIFCSGQDSDIIAAIEYYTSFGVRVSSNSYGGGPLSQALMDAIRASHSVFVAAAGNGGLDALGDDNDITPHYPSGYELHNIIAVAATNDKDEKASFSNFGQTSVDLGAPGVNILSTLPGSAYGYLSGTSMATPHVAGVAALVLAQHESLTNLEVKWRLILGTDFTGLPVLTGGRLNAAKALQLQPAVTIQVTPLTPTTVGPGDFVSYEVTYTNLSPTPKTLTSVILLRIPDGREAILQTPTTFELPGGGSSSQTISGTMPTPLPLVLIGTNRLVGRVFTPGTFESFDEHEVLYEFTP